MSAGLLGRQRFMEHNLCAEVNFFAGVTLWSWLLVLELGPGSTFDRGRRRRRWLSEWLQKCYTSIDEPADDISVGPRALSSQFLHLTFILCSSHAPEMAAVFIKSRLLCLLDFTYCYTFSELGRRWLRWLLVKKKEATYKWSKNEKLQCHANNVQKRKKTIGALTFL